VEIRGLDCEIPGADFLVVGHVLSECKHRYRYREKNKLTAFYWATSDVSWLNQRSLCCGVPLSVPHFLIHCKHLQTIISEHFPLQNIQDILADNEQSTLSISPSFILIRFHLTSKKSAREKKFSAETTEELPVQA
jgi:hypothetical protein